MSVPILKLNDIFITTIQEDLTDKEALSFQNDVLNQAATGEAIGIVIDITGLDVVDSYMARVLNETAEMVRVMGLETVICGMRPMVALTLIEMGRKLLGVNTALDLDRALVKIRAIADE